MSTIQRGYAYPLENPRRRERNYERPQRRVVPSSRWKGRMLVVVIFIGMMAMGTIVMVAYGASIKYDINNTIAETKSILAETEELEVKINRAKNIYTIEDKAINELGMIYPTADQYIYIDQNAEGVDDLAQRIRENAYAVW